VDNLTVNIGARFDYQRSKNLASSTPANPTFPSLLPAVSYGGDSGYPITGARFSHAWVRLMPSGRTEVTLLARVVRTLRGPDRAGGYDLSAFPAAIRAPRCSSNPGSTDGSRTVEPGEIDLAGGLVDAATSTLTTPPPTSRSTRISADLKPPGRTRSSSLSSVRSPPLLSASLAYTHRSLTNPEFSPLIGTTLARAITTSETCGHSVDERTGFGLDFSEPYLRASGMPRSLRRGSRSRTGRTHAKPTTASSSRSSRRFPTAGCCAVGAAYNNWRQRIGPGAIVDPNNITPASTRAGPSWTAGSTRRGSSMSAGMVRASARIRAGLNFFGRQWLPDSVLVDTEISWDPYWYAVPQLQMGGRTTTGHGRVPAGPAGREGFC
jgi:hypothetical protein